ncbi:MAG: hypothetical protein H7Z38_10715 [Rubrivivax sp.]|nr:hypothetical protein [Pyrinomonadaceae bacterium]
MSTDRLTEILNYLSAMSRDMSEFRQEVRACFDRIEACLDRIEARLDSIEAGADRRYRKKAGLNGMTLV